jgi:hypothetical protein
MSASNNSLFEVNAFEVKALRLAYAKYLDIYPKLVDAVFISQTRCKPKPKLKPNLIPDALRPIMGELLDAKPVSSERLSELERKVVAADALDHEKDKVLKIIARKRVLC